MDTPDTLGGAVIKVEDAIKRMTDGVTLGVPKVLSLTELLPSGVR